MSKVPPKGTYLPKTVPKAMVLGEGVEQDDLSLAVSGIEAANQQYDALLKAQGIQRASDALERQAAGMTDEQDSARLKEIMEALPDSADVRKMEDELGYRRTAIDWMRGKGKMGNTYLDDQQEYLSRILKKRGRPDSEEARIRLLAGLLQTAREKTPYSSSNFLFDPSQRAIDLDAANVLQAWSMKNLRKKYDNPKELYENIGKDIRQQEALRNEALKLTMKDQNTGRKPQGHIRGLLITQTDGSILSDAMPHFDDATNQTIAKSVGDEVTSFIYNDNTNKNVLRLVEKGMTQARSKNELAMTLGNAEDAERLYANMYTAPGKRFPGEVVIPMSRDIDGTLHLPMEMYTLAMRDALFRDLAERDGYQMGKIPPSKVQEYREQALATATAQLAPLRAGRSATAWVDPYKAYENFQEGKGVRANVVKLLQTAATVLTLGVDETFLGDIPDKLIRSSAALTLPRSASGVLFEEGKARKPIRQGEYFAPVLGDYGVTNTLDGILRLNPIESIAASYSLAADDDARAGKGLAGRSGRILRNMVNNFDTPRHHRRIVSGTMHGARLMMEAGDAFINPLLGKVGEEVPEIGRAAGMLGVLAAYVVTPDALLGLAASTRAIAPASRATARALGMEFRTVLANGKNVVTKAYNDAEALYGSVDDLTTEQLIEFDKFVQARIRADKTGAASVFNYVAQFKTAKETAGLSVSLESGAALQESINYFSKVQSRAAKLADEAKLKFAEASATKDALTKTTLELEALDALVKNSRLQTEGLEILLKTNAKQLAEDTARLNAFRTFGRLDTDITTKQPSLFPPKGILNSDQLVDALRVKAGVIKFNQFFTRHADKNGKIAGFTKKQLKKNKSAKFDEIVTDTVTTSRPFANAVMEQSVKVRSLTKTRDSLRKHLKEIKTQALSKVNDQIPKVLAKAGRQSASLSGAAKQVRKASKAVADQVAKVNDDLSDAKLKIATDEAVNVVGKNLNNRIYKDYLTNLRDLSSGAEQLLRLPSKLSDDMFTRIALRSTDEIAADSELLKTIRGNLDESSDLLKMSDRELAEQIMTTDAMVKIFEEPGSFIQLSVRNQARMLTNPKAWVVKGTIAARGMIKSFPVFRTNVQYLGIPVRADLDEGAKRMARKTQDIMDQLNLSVKNVEGLEAKREVMDTILSTAGRTPDLEYKARLPGTPAARITMTGLLGLDKPMATEMVHYLIGQGRLRSKLKGTGVTLASGTKKGLEVPFMPDEALGAAVTAFIPDRVLRRPSKFMEETFPKIQGFVLARMVEKADDLMAADGRQSLFALREAIKDALQTHRVQYEVTDITNVKFTQAVVLGSMQSIWADRVFHIIGPRFNVSAARGVNSFSGLGRHAEDYIPQPVKVGDYVILKREARAFDDLTRVANTEQVGGVADASVMVRRGKTEEAIQRSPFVEAEASKLMGTSSRRVNKIEDGMVYFNTDEPPVPVSQVVHRDITVSMLDAFDGFAAFGITNLTTIGRKQILNELGTIRDTYQRMMIHSLDAQGNVRMMPRALMDRFSESLDNITKQLDEAVSEQGITHPIVQVYMAGMKMGSTFMSFFKRHILYGLLTPRPQYFTNMHFGEYAQIADGIGLREALPLTLMGSMGSIPVFGKSLQNSMFAMSRSLPPGKVALPSATGASFNSSLDKIFRASDEVLYVGPDGKAVKAATFYAEGIEDGVGEYLRIDGIEKIIRDELDFQVGRNPGVMRAAFNSYEDYARLVELKIREVTRRQRMLLYAHLRINKKLEREAAKKILIDSMYDWSLSVSKLERRYLGEMALFYTLTKNGYAQVFRQLFEPAFDESLKAYLGKYIKGGTKIQRMEALSRFTGARAGFSDPYKDLTIEERKQRLEEKSISRFYTDYGIIGMGSIQPNMIDQMFAEAGFAKYNYARVTPKFTTVEFATSTANLAASLTAILAAGLVEKPYEVVTGKEAPISVNVGKATTNLLEEVTDTALNPIYGTMLEAIYRDARGTTFNKSPYGRKLRPGDLAMVETLRQFGIDGSFATIQQDTQNPKMRRIMLNPNVPLANEILWSIGRTELHRMQMIAGLLFPGMAPAEIRALAENKEGRVRLELAASLFNFGKAVFYNGKDNYLNELKTSKEQIAQQVRVIEQQQQLPLKKED